MKFLHRERSATSFKKEATSILGVFTRTQAKLEILVEDQQHYAQEVEDKITALSVEKKLINADIADNNAVIAKIKALLS